MNPQLQYALDVICRIKYSEEHVFDSWSHGDILSLFDTLAKSELTYYIIFLAEYLCETKRNYILGYAIELHRTKQTNKHNYNYAYLDEPTFTILKNIYEGKRAF